MEGRHDGRKPTLTTVTSIIVCCPAGWHSPSRHPAWRKKWWVGAGVLAERMRKNRKVSRTAASAAAPDPVAGSV